GFEDDVFEGTARVFEREQHALDALADGTITHGDVVVIRYEGPKGGPGMREMLAITGATKGAGWGKAALRRTDGPRARRATGRCGGDPLRRPRGRPGDARDARHHRSDQGRGLGQGRAADDRRALLRRHHRAVRGTYRPGGGRRRTDRVRARRGPDPAGRVDRG